MAGEIATAFVRIRPNLTGFKTTATEGVKAALTETQTAVNTSARANIAATQQEIASNKELVLSYEEVMAIAQANVAAVAEGVSANRTLATAYVEVGRAAQEGSVEQIAAIRLANEATVGAATTTQEAARANVAATLAEIRANEELAASYKIVALAAAKGSQEQIVAATLAARSSEAAAAAGGVGAAAGTSFKTGFKAALGTGGELLGVGIGAALTADLVKHLAEDAAGVQKSQEVIRSEFGKSSEEIIDFAEKTGIALGITSHASLDTAAKLGIVFQNLGIGHKVAADMTVGLESLAGSLAAIRGIDPAVPLRALNLAMLGNVRSLKQLGIAVDPVTIKYVAFKMGLIDSVKDGLTPAARAQAIYAISTQNLSKFQALAAAHSDDLSNSQRRLSASWDQAKEKLGADLLPAFSAFTKGLGEALKGFLALPTAGKAAIATAVGVGAAFAAVALGLSPIIGIPIAIIAIGLAFNEAYQHSKTFREFINGIGDQIKQLGPTLTSIKQSIHEFWAAFGDQISSIAIGHLKLLGTIIKTDVQIIIDIIKVFAAVLHGDWGKAWSALKDIFVQEWNALKAIVATAANDLTQIFSAMWKSIEILFLEGLKGVADLLAKIPTSVTIFGKTIGGENPFKGWSDSLKGTIAGLSGSDTAAAAQKVGKDVAENVAKGAKDASGKPLSQEAADFFKQQGLDAATTKAKDQLQKARNAVTTAENALGSLKGRLAASIEKTSTDVRAAVEDAKGNLTSIGSSLAQSLSTIIDQPFVVAGQKIQDAQDKITLEFDRKSQALRQQAAAISREQQVLAFGSDKLALSRLRGGVVLPTGGGLSTDNTKAIAQLKALAATAKGGNKDAINEFLIQFRGAALTVASDKNSLAQGALDAKKTVLTNALQLKSEVLQVQQDTANRMKTQIATQIADLTDAFNRHVITYARFKQGIQDIVSKGGPAMKQAGATLGSAFANSYAQQVSDLLKQAGLIGDGPQVPGTTGQQSKIVNPGAVLRADQAASDRIRNQIANKQTTLQQKLVTEAKKQTAYLSTLAGGGRDAPSSKDKNPGKQTKTSQAHVGIVGGGD